MGPFLLAIFYPEVGKLAGILGSLSALACIYVLPTITYLKSKYTEIKHPMLAEALDKNEFDIRATDVTSPKITIRHEFLKKNLKKPQMSEK
jgi:hypothetical protein